ncbi:hypothetical protein ACFL6W_08795 [Thermodesulfobacteriota bacterium]
MNNKNNGKIVEKKKLVNGLDLIMSFQSIPIAGDRYQVVFEVVINAEIKEAYFDNELLSDLNPENVIRLLGDKTPYQYSKVRNFVAGDEKGNILEGLKQQFLESNLTYLSSPLFPVKLIKRNYMKAEKEEIIRIKKKAYLN